MKNQRKMFVFLKLILFVGFIGLLYFQLKKTHWSSLPEVSYPIFLLIAFLFVPINWLFEYLKWNETLRFSMIDLKSKDQFQSFFAGIVTGMLTPNMLGNFIGRLYYVPWKKRIEVIVLTMLTNYSQFLASILFGTIAIIIQPSALPVLKNETVAIVCLLLTILFIWGLFKWSILVRKILHGKVIDNLTLRYTENSVLSARILLWSLLRHSVFTIQFLAVLMAFGIVCNVNNILLIWQTYLLTTLVPSPFFGKIGVRDSIAVWVFGFASIDAYIVLVSSLIIWVINLLLPTFVGLVICKRRQSPW